MLSRCSCFYLIKQNFNFSTSSILFRSHYDSLGITPKATQTDIKTAYYKLSMVYHPDKNKGSVDASKKFQDISAAYEVLGNYKLRRLYDKGLLHTAGPQFSQAEPEIVEDEDPQAGFYRSRQARRTAPPPTGRTPIYDFDEWSKAHYGATFDRTVRAKQKYKEKIAKIERDKVDIKNERVIGFLLFSLFIFFLFSYTSKTDYDEVIQENRVNPK